MHLTTSISVNTISNETQHAWGQLIYYHCYQIVQSSEMMHEIFPTCRQVKPLNKYMKLLQIELKYQIDILELCKNFW